MQVGLGRKSSRARWTADLPATGCCSLLGQNGLVGCCLGFRV